MITNVSQYQYGRCKIMGLQSVNVNDLEQAEREIFDRVFGSVQYTDITGETTARAVVAEMFAPFVWAQFQRNRAQYVAASGQVTQSATSYGVVATSRVLRVWNEGVDAGRRLYATHKDDIVAEFPHLRFIADYVL